MEDVLPIHQKESNVFVINDDKLRPREFCTTDLVKVTLTFF